MKPESPSPLAVEKTVQFFFADPDWNFKLGLGCLLNGAAFALLLFNVLLLPLSFCLWSLVLGYLLATIKAKVDNPSNNLPSWKNVLDIMFAGGTWIGAASGHFAIFLSIVLASLAVGEITGLDNVLAPVFVLWASAIWTLMLIAGAAASLISLYLMVNFATQQNLGAAFDLKAILKRLRRQPGQFLLAWLIQVGLIYLGTLLPVLTVLGIFIIPSTVFFAQLVGCCIISQAWRASEI